VFSGKIKEFPEEGDLLMADPLIGEMLLNETISTSLLKFKKDVYQIEEDVIVFIYNSA
jgi:hypothetical protein